MRTYYEKSFNTGVLDKNRGASGKPVKVQMNDMYIPVMLQQKEMQKAKTIHEN